MFGCSLVVQQVKALWGARWSALRAVREGRIKSLEKKIGLLWSMMEFRKQDKSRKEYKDRYQRPFSQGLPFFFFFLLHQWHMEVLRPEIKPSWLYGDSTRFCTTAGTPCITFWISCLFKNWGIIYNWLKKYISFMCNRIIWYLLWKDFYSKSY